MFGKTINHDAFLKYGRMMSLSSVQDLGERLLQPLTQINVIKLDKYREMMP